MFVTHLEAGPVALLAVGLIFMIVGLAGTLPTRLKVGDNEAAWEIERQAVETFVERVADATPVANQREFLGALSDLAEDAPRIAGPALSGLAYERLVMSMIAEAVTTLREDRTLPGLNTATEQRQFDRGRDALISVDDGRKLLVEIKAFEHRLGREMLEQLQRYREQMPGPSAALLITRHGTPTSEALARWPHTYHIVVGGREDQNELTRIMRRAFDELPRTRPSNGSKKLAPSCEHYTSLGSPRRRWYRCRRDSYSRYCRKPHRTTLGQPARRQDMGSGTTTRTRAMASGGRGAHLRASPRSVRRLLPSREGPGSPGIQPRLWL